MIIRVRKTSIYRIQYIYKSTILQIQVIVVCIQTVASKTVMSLIDSMYANWAWKYHSPYL